jgi:hypothetical protein
VQKRARARNTQNCFLYSLLPTVVASDVDFQIAEIEAKSNFGVSTQPRSRVATCRCSEKAAHLCMLQPTKNQFVPVVLPPKNLQNLKQVQVEALERLLLFGLVRADGHCLGRFGETDELTQDERVGKLGRARCEEPR